MRPKEINESKTKIRYELRYEILWFLPKEHSMGSKENKAKWAMEKKSAWLQKGSPTSWL